MNHKTRSELVRKVGLFGMRDLKKIAPIGDIGYANGWNPPFWGEPRWDDTEMPKTICREAKEQGYKFECINYNHRGTDTEYFCRELGLYYHVDSSD